ncbi:MAG: DinB family protein [Chloracidobacterium sp.]|nr:DinB family protein [Chloracidobacterium sp.]
MRYESIADIYSANEKFRGEFINTVTAISPDEATALPDGEKWSIQQIVEHVSIVNAGVAGLCARMLEKAKADGKTSDGSFALSESFGAQAAGIAQNKLEAPDRVHPTGEVSIAESLERFAANVATLDAIKDELAQFDLSEHKFPHPYFGPLNSGEVVSRTWPSPKPPPTADRKFTCKDPVIKKARLKGG